jgi:hypothetical protein
LDTKNKKNPYWERIKNSLKTRWEHVGNKRKMKKILLMSEMKTMFYYKCEILSYLFK